MKDSDFTEKLWNIANLLTGFAVVQTMSFVYACSKPEFADLINRPLVKITIAVHLVVVTLFECYGVWWCGRKVIELFMDNQPPGDGDNTKVCVRKKILRHVTLGRILVIVALLVPALLSLYARQLGGIPFSK